MADNLRILILVNATGDAVPAVIDLSPQKVKMSQQSRSSSVSSEESMEPFLAFIEKARLKCPSPPPDAATAATTTTNEGPVLDSQSTTADKFEALSAAVMLQREDLHHLLRDAQGKAPEEEKPTSSATAPGPDQGELVDKLKAEIKQLRNALNVAQWQLREAGRVQTEAPNTFEATMTEVIEAVNDKWEDYNSLSSVTDPAKVIEDLRKRNKELEEENKNLDRNGFMPKRMHDLVNKVKAHRGEKLGAQGQAQEERDGKSRCRQDRRARGRDHKDHQRESRAFQQAEEHISPVQSAQRESGSQR
uniref:Uncharacterized protein n=1 Tax=Pyricularia oryzae (strain P131) TaxID=1143193 RepID=L7JPY3_PYRO1